MQNIEITKNGYIMTIMSNRIKIEYELIKDMRKDKATPVDTMGCHLFKDDYKNI